MSRALAKLKQSFVCPYIDYTLPFPGLGELSLSSTAKAEGSGVGADAEPAFTVYEEGEIDEAGEPLGPTGTQIIELARTMSDYLSNRETVVIGDSTPNQEAASQARTQALNSSASALSGEPCGTPECPLAPKKPALNVLHNETGGAVNDTEELSELHKKVRDVLRRKLSQKELDKMTLHMRPRRKLAQVQFESEPDMPNLRQRLLPPKKRVKGEEPEDEVIWAEDLSGLRNLCNTAMRLSKGRIKNIEDDVFRFEKKWVALFDQLDALVVKNGQAISKLSKNLDRTITNVGKILQTVSHLTRMLDAVVPKDHPRGPKNKARGAKKRKQDVARRFVLWEIFSGTGTFGRTFREEFGWEVYQIDSSRDLARKTGAVCADVRNFDFSTWPHPDLIFFAPPCTGWSNATKKSVRDSPAMDDMKNLVRWSLALARRVKPTVWVLENPRHTALAKQDYMKHLATTHWAFCRYGRPYQKETTLWHSSNLRLKLLECRCTTPHAVKLGGTYNGQHKWKRKNAKMSLPVPFCRTMAEQITEFLRKTDPAPPRAVQPKPGPAPSESDDWVKRSVRARKNGFKRALRDHDTPVNIHGVILPYDADTGADETVMTQATLDWIVKHAATPIEVTTVPPYSTMLANGARVVSRTVAYCDFELITHVGSTILKRVKCNVLPGEVIAEILLGLKELHALGITPVKKQVHDAIERRIKEKERRARAARLEPIVDLEEIDGRLQIPPREKRAQAVPEMRPVEADSGISLKELQKLEWQRRLQDSREGEPPSLESLDSFHAHGAETPTSEDLMNAIADAIERARKAGASEMFLKKLTFLLTRKYKHLWRLQLGADSAARVKPLKLTFDEQRFPKNVHPRRYSPPQQEFLDKQIAEMVRVGILKKSTTRFVAPPFLPIKKDGSYRFCVDSRIQNRCTEAHSYPIPVINHLLTSLKNGKVWACFDHCRGFFQFPLARESQKYCGIITHAGTWQFTRCIMGCVNSAGHYVDTMRSVLDGTADPTTGPADKPDPPKKVDEQDPDVIKRRINLLTRRMASYVDEQIAAGDGDTLADAEMDLLETMDIYFHRCSCFKIKLKITKCEFWLKSLEWCGHLVSEKGISIAPSKLKALDTVPVPENGGELMQFICSINFLRNKLPLFTQMIAPLREILNECLNKSKRRTKQNAARVLLKDVGWSEKHTRAFQKCKQSLRDAITLVRYDDRTQTLCLLADASGDHFGSVLTCIPDEDINKPISEQRHSPVEMLSGSFKKDTAPHRWAINQKELYAIVHAVKHLRYWLCRPKPWLLYTDHRNLVYCLKPSIARVRASQASMDRLVRWSWELTGLNYRVVHITSEENVVADMLSRWGSGERSEEAHSPATYAKMRVIKARYGVRRVICDLEGSKAGHSCLLCKAAKLTAAKIGEPSTIYELPKPWQWPTVEEIAASQKKHQGGPRDAKYHRNANGLLVDKNDRVYIPPDDALKTRICIVAHTGAAGHRGLLATLKSVARVFVWDKQREFVQKFCKKCVQCIRNESGKLRPLPWGEQIVAERPAQVLCADYLYMQATSKSGDKYLLVMKDSFSCLCRLVPTDTPDALTFVRALQQWCAQYGVPEVLITDGGSHFKNGLTSLMRKALQFRHHITLAYTPWSNSQAERHNREILKIFRCLCSERKWNTNRWTDLTPLVEYALNTSTIPTLGVSPIECHTGIRPRDSVQFLTVHGARLSTVVKDVPKKTLVTKHLAKIRRILDEMHDYAKRKKRSNREKNWRSQKNAAEPNIHIGDYVLAAVIDRKSKLHLSWDGPYQVIGTKNRHVYVLQHPNTKEKKEAHGRRLKRYCGAQDGEHAELVSAAVSEEGEWKADRILSWKHQKNSATVELEVLWAGFPREWATFEKLESLIEDKDSRAVVRRFLKREIAKKPEAILQEKLDHIEAGKPTEGAARLKGPLKSKATKNKKQRKLKGDLAVLGARVSIYWPSMKTWYEGQITHVDPKDEALTVTYDDGEELTYGPNFEGWRWKLVYK